MTEPRLPERDVPPLPHLTGKQAPVKIKQRVGWAFLTANTALLLFGLAVFCLPLPFLFFNMVWGPKPAAMTPINLFIVTVFPPGGAVLVAVAVWGFVRWARRRKESAGE